MPRIAPHYLDEIFEHISRPPDLQDIVPVLVTAGVCGANRHREQLYMNIHASGLVLENLRVVCFSQDDMPWPVPMNPVLYFFKPGVHKPMFLVQGGMAAEGLEEWVAKARRMMDEGVSFDEISYSPDELAIIEEAEASFTESEELPPVFAMVRSLGIEAWKVARAAGRKLPVLAKPEVVRKRYETCLACRHLTRSGRCTKCGCFMQAKVNLATTSCPVGKWTEAGPSDPNDRQNHNAGDLTTGQRTKTGDNPATEAAELARLVPLSPGP